MKTFSLRSVKLRSGEEYRDAIKLELTPFEYGGQRYLPVPNEVPAELELRDRVGLFFGAEVRDRLYAVEALDGALLLRGCVVQPFSLHYILNPLFEGRDYPHM